MLVALMTAGDLQPLEYVFIATILHVEEVVQHGEVNGFTETSGPGIQEGPINSVLSQLDGGTTIHGLLDAIEEKKS